MYCVYQDSYPPTDWHAAQFVTNIAALSCRWNHTACFVAGHDKGLTLLMTLLSTGAGPMGCNPEEKVW